MASRWINVLLLSVFLVAVPEVRSASFLRVRSFPSNLTQAASSSEPEDTNNGTLDMTDKSVDYRLEADTFEDELVGQVDTVEEDAEAELGAQPEQDKKEQTSEGDAVVAHHDAAAPKAPKKEVQAVPEAPKKKVQPLASHKEKAPAKVRGTYNYITGKYASLLQMDEARVGQAFIQMGKDVDDSENLEDLDEDDAKVVSGESEGDDTEEDTQDEAEEDEDESSQDTQEGQTDEEEDSDEEEESDEETDQGNEAEDDTEGETSEGDEEENSEDGESNENAEEESSEDDNDDDN